MVLDPSREGSEGPTGRSDYSEIHFSANALGKTTPKRVFLPTKPRTHLVPCLTLLARRAFFLDDHHRERSLRAVRPSFDI